jgi:DNA-binding IclR family transcriptional regulator
MPDAAAQRDRKFVMALARGLEVLRAFTPSEGLLGNQDIATRTGLPKATVSRLTYTLMRLGYLSHFARLGKYQLAPAAMSLGYSALANMRVREVARPFMQELADYSRASVALGSRDRLSLVYIENCRSENGVTLRLDVGARVPIATTATSRGTRAAAGRACAPGSSRRSTMWPGAASRCLMASGGLTSARSAYR